MSAIRKAIQAEIQSLAAQQLKLESILRQLGGEDSRPAEASIAVTKSSRTKKRLRLKDEVAKDMGVKIVKAVKAHKGGGASRKDIVTYLDRSGWKVGHHFNDPHLNKLVTTLISGDAPAIRREGEKGNTRYHAV